jgi:hypothetical protein
VGERVGDRPLEQLLDRGVERPAGGQEGIEGLQRLEEALLFLGPGARLGRGKAAPMWARICTGRRPAAENPAK